MMGVKIYGSNLNEIERIGLQVEQILKDTPGATDVVADRIVGKPYIEFRIDREKIARYGVSIRDVQDVIEIAIGGENLTMSVEGRERYPIRVRYPREQRDNLEELQRILVPAASGAQVPINQVADVRYTLGPQEIKSENTLLVGYVTMNTRDRDEVSVVEDAEALIQGKIESGELTFPPGYYYQWAGQFENQVRAMQPPEDSDPAVPVAGLRVALLRAEAVVDRPAGVFRHSRVRLRRVHHVVFLGLQHERGGMGRVHRHVWRGRRRQRSRLDLYRGPAQGTASGHGPGGPRLSGGSGRKRIRPNLMATATTVLGLIPVFLVTGRGSDVMQPMAVPSVGGMAVGLITLFITPCVYCWVEEWKVRWQNR